MSDEPIDEKINKINELLSQPGVGFVDIRRTVKVQIAKGVADPEENIEYLMQEISNGIKDAAEALESRNEERELTDDLISIANEIKELGSTDLDDE